MTPPCLISAKAFWGWKMAGESGPLGRLELARYSALAVPLAFASLPLYLHAPELYASEFGLSLVDIGAALLALRVIDAIQDPLIGSLSDRFHRFRRQICVASLALLGGGFWAIFNPQGSAPLLWFSCSIFICALGFSALTINFHTLGGLWQVSEAERTRVTGWRETFGLLGLLAASILPTLLGGGERPVQAFQTLSLALLALLVACGIIFLRWASSAQVQPPGSKPDGGGSFLSMADSWCAGFFAIYFLSAFANAIPAVLVLFFINDVLGAESLTGFFLLLYFLSGAALMPFWQWLSRRIGKLEAWLAGMLLAILSFVWAFFLEGGDVVEYAIICSMSGLALGSGLSLPPAIVADRIAAKMDYANSSRHFSLLNFLGNAALTLATGTMLPLLGFLGYQPGAVSAGISSHLSFVYALVPCFFGVLAAAALFCFLTSLKRMDRHEKTGFFDRSCHAP